MFEPQIQNWFLLWWRTLLSPTTGRKKLPPHLALNCSQLNQTKFHPRFLPSPVIRPRPHDNRCTSGSWATRGAPQHKNTHYNVINPSAQISLPLTDRLHFLPFTPTCFWQIHFLCINPHTRLPRRCKRPGWSFSRKRTVNHILSFQYPVMLHKPDYRCFSSHCGCRGSEDAVCDQTWQFVTGQDDSPVYTNIQWSYSHSGCRRRMKDVLSLSCLVNIRTWAFLSDEKNLTRDGGPTNSWVLMICNVSWRKQGES